MPTAIVGSRGRITIRKPVRDGLGVETGDRVEFVELEKGVYTVVAATRDTCNLKGIIPKPTRPVNVEDMHGTLRRLARRRPDCLASNRWRDLNKSLTGVNKIRSQNEGEA